MRALGDLAELALELALGDLKFAHARDDGVLFAAAGDEESRKEQKKMGPFHTGPILPFRREKRR